MPTASAATRLYSRVDLPDDMRVDMRVGVRPTEAAMPHPARLQTPRGGKAP